MNEDPTKHNSTQEQQAGWEFSKGRSVLATVALNGALLVNGALPHGEVDVHRTSTEQVQEVVVDEVTGEATSTQNVEMPFQSMDSVGEQWARRFAEDPQAGELLQESETARVASGIKEMLDTNQDCQIDTIELTGRASDDDDNTNEQGVRTAGLGEPDADGENIELAEKRSSVFEEKLRAELVAQGVDPSQLPFVQMPGVEDLMDSSEIEQVDAFVEQFGYDSRTQLVEQYNRDPDSVPPAALEFLDQTLKSERTVTVSIKGTCEEQVQSTVETTEYVERVERKEVQKEYEVTIPWFMIVPVPMFRRNNEQTEPTEPRINPTLPVVPPKPTTPKVVPPTPPPPGLPKDHAFKRREHEKFTGPTRGPKRYVGPNVHGGYWHV